MKADRSELQSAPHFTRPANSPATLSAGRQRLRFQRCVIFELRPRERVTPFHSTTLAPVDKDLQAVRVEAEVSVQGRSRRSGHGRTTFQKPTTTLLSRRKLCSYCSLLISDCAAPSSTGQLVVQFRQQSRRPCFLTAPRSFALFTYAFDTVVQ